MDSLTKHLSDKLEFETDSWDLHEAWKKDYKVVVIDARSVKNCQAEPRSWHFAIITAPFPKPNKESADLPEALDSTGENPSSNPLLWIS